MCVCGGGGGGGGSSCCCQSKIELVFRGGACTNTSLPHPGVTTVTPFSPRSLRLPASSANTTSNWQSLTLRMPRKLKIGASPSLPPSLSSPLPLFPSPSLPPSLSSPSLHFLSLHLFLPFSPLLFLSCCSSTTGCIVAAFPSLDLLQI